MQEKNIGYFGIFLSDYVKKRILFILGFGYFSRIMSRKEYYLFLDLDISLGLCQERNIIYSWIIGLGDFSRISLLDFMARKKYIGLVVVILMWLCLGKTS